MVHTHMDKSARLLVFHWLVILGQDLREAWRTVVSSHRTVKKYMNVVVLINYKVINPV